ncbi:patatin-like phospholipase family protein [Bacillus sp. FJAT-45350]|uniref:patatin-like phospholipase family protein n=1 Tax=Bacillus sp. FJAT-45350 TaxID=2011014 RepID=UPI000BB7AE9F|nr:patatin family protein [Bacillus sp. FJAT-45350]
MENVGLVLEGGGMRGLYTAGVLEYFLEQELFFPYVVGVSAGACMAATYLSRQKGRNKKVNTGLVHDPRYLSYRNLFTKRQLFGMDFLFDEIPNKVVPFDFDTFLNGKERFSVGTTDCYTGEATYFEKNEHGDNMLQIIRASSSLPFIAPPVHYDGKVLLDGGLIDPIPIRKSQMEGFNKNVVIMTKAEDFQRKPTKLASLANFFYRSYPTISGLLQTRHEVYNETLSFLKKEEEQGSTFIIQPSIELPVSPIERNQKKLIDLYELGYEDAKKQWGELTKWISS